jgi:membrane fusion protein, multidrug efflux system
MQREHLWRGLSVIFGVTLLAACGDKVASPATVPAAEVKTLVVMPQAAPIAPEFVGQTESSQQVEVRARVSGFLEQRVFTEGSTVKAGQPMFVMDRKPFEAALLAAKSEAAAQQARLEVARQNLGRIKPLAEQNALSQKDLDDAVGQERTAAAAVEAAKAKVIQAELNLGYTTIYAPVSGLSSFAKLQEGSYVDVSNSLLTYVAKLDPMRVNFSLSENEVLRFRDEVSRGEVKAPPADAFEVEIVLADGSVFPARGRLTFSDAAFSQDTGTFLVRAELPNPKSQLRPGQFVRVRLIGATRPGSYLVPQRAVQQGPRGSFLWIAGKDGKAEMRAVVTGSWVGDDWLISNGLRAGEAVIVDGTLKLAPGVPVKVIGTLPAAPAPSAAIAPAGGGKTSPALRAADQLLQPTAPVAAAPAAAADAASGLPARVNFASASAVLPADDAKRLARVAAYLAANRGARVEISGHADKRGGAMANAALAKARAESVRSALLVGGASEDQLLLQAPTSVTGSGADDDARRVEVILAGTP